MEHTTTIAGPAVNGRKVDAGLVEADGVHSGNVWVPFFDPLFSSKKGSKMISPKSDTRPPGVPVDVFSARYEAYLGHFDCLYVPKKPQT